MDATARHFQVTYKSSDAKDALKKAIPSMDAGFNVNTLHGDFSLHGDDAKAVMNLVRELAERRAAVAETPKTEDVITYNHAFTLAFQLGGSLTEDGEDVSAEQMRDALRARINALMDNDEMLEAVGAPFDTFEE